MKKLKILHVSTASGWRGGERQALLLIKNLNKLYPHIENYLFCAKNSVIEQTAIIEKIPYKSARKLFPQNPFFVSALMQYAQKIGADIIHTHDAHAHTFAYNTTKLGYEPKLVVARRVDVPIRQQKHSQDKYLSPYVQKVICVSEKIKEICDEACDGLEEKSVCIHSGIDLEFIKKYFRNGTIHKILKLSPEKKIVGNIAALVDHKDYPTFLNTARLMLKKNPNLHFVVLGDGPLKEELILLRKKLEIENDVSFLGYQEDIYPYLIEFDLFLFTSKTEGLGSSVLDAFAAKIPVVATNGGGISEMVQDRETGLMAEVGDAKKLSEYGILALSDQNLAQKLRENAFQKVQDFSAEKTAEKTEKIYQEIFNHQS